jgi:hypothetical protein
MTDKMMDKNADSDKNLLPINIGLTHRFRNRRQVEICRCGRRESNKTMACERIIGNARV